MGGYGEAVLLALGKEAVSPVLGSLVSGRAQIVVKTIVGARGTVVTGVDVLAILTWQGWGKLMLGKARLGGIASFHSPGVGGGMSGIRLVGALGRDQTYVSPGNPSYRKSNGRRGGAREGGVPGAGVGPGSGGNRVRFQAESLPKSGVGVDAAEGIQTGDGKSQRDKILEAVQVLKLLLGQEVCSQVEDLI